jgi:serine/threonine protein phosphatase PrpC
LRELPFIGTSGEEIFPLIVANSGDSPAMIIGKDGKIRFITKDHKTSDPEEKKRIIDAGGTVLFGRVDGILAVSRAFGDWYFKNDRKLLLNQQKVISLPDFHQETIIPGELLLLASDGVYENTTAEIIAKFIYDEWSSSEDFSENIDLILRKIASKLVNWSFSTNFSNDNLSAMLITV